MNLAALFSLLAATNRYRLIDFNFPKIPPASLNLPSQPFIVIGLIVLSFVLGNLFARAVRMRDYGWKVGLILATLFVSLFAVLFGEFKMGVDLKGGVILVYEVDEIQTKSLNPKGDEWSMAQLIAVISKRLNPDGLKEIVVRPFGPKQVEIVVPEVDPEEVKKIKLQVETGGVLQFMIVAGDRDTELLELARQQATRPGEEKLRPDVNDEQGHRVGFWAKLGREDGKPETAPFRSPDLIVSGIIRDKYTGEILDLTPLQKGLFAENDSAFKAFLAQRGTRDVDVLMVYDPDFDIRGDDLAYASPDYDESLRPCIRFGMKTYGADKMGYLTQNNLQRKLAIIFDNVVLSAPVIQSKISDSGQITGGFTREKVDFIVGILKSGSMPVVMQKKPISENQIGSILGRDTIEQGSRSVVVALGLVLLFMVIYYQFAGVVAAFALTLNLLLTVAIMISLQAPFTLPGLAGLVLTVAMSVDANVLITERMREELARGAAFRMAIRNGFDKALSAIVDGNLTTFLTALVLYFIGTDQVKGFGMTLMLGNITSMFTAIFCARVILDISERTRWVKTLRMGSFLTNPKVDWVRFLLPAMAGSVLLIVIGLVATVLRGKGLFDIDLAGGTSVTFLLKDPMQEEEVRKKVGDVLDDMRNPVTKTSIDYNVYGMTVETQPKDTVYKVDSSLEDVDLLKKTVQDTLPLRTFRMDIGVLTEVHPSPAEPPKLSAPGKEKAPSKEKPAEPAAAPQAKPEPKAAPEEKAKAPPPTEEKKTEEKGTEPADKGGEKKAAESEEKSSSCDDPPAVAKSDDPAEKAKDAPAADEKEKAAAKDEKPTEKAKNVPAADQKEKPAAKDEKSAEKASETPKAEPAPPTIEASVTPPAPVTPVATANVQTKAELRLPGSPIGGVAIRDRLVESSKAVVNKVLDIRVENPEWNRIDNATYESWTVTLPVDKAQADAILKHAKSQLESEVVWQTSSKIGGQVSADTRWRAIGALAVSMLGIVAYVWFRFQQVAWGLAAVSALAHDALVMLTSIALSYWFTTSLGFLGVEEFKISLPVVAAFLTILGYSVNDTIVIFDRLREIRGKSPTVTRQMLNDAVNQTLGRTIILFGITLVTVLILYGFGGPGIHAFAFALVTGVISGCYSTLAIAAPILLWLLNREALQPLPPTQAEKREATKSVA